MIYDFTTIMDRSGKDALAVDAIGSYVNWAVVPTAPKNGFLHCEEYCKKHGIGIDELIQRGWDVGVAWQQGAPFHDEWGIRMNLALPYSLMMEAMDRLTKYVFLK